MLKLQTVSSIIAIIFAFGHLNAAIDNGLIGFYTFEGNANDTSGNRNNGTLGTVTQATGFEGNAYEFAGSTSSIITLPIDINAAILPQMTFGAWVNTTSIAGGAAILSNDLGGFGRQIGYDDRGPGSTTDYSVFVGLGVGSGLEDLGNEVVANKWFFLAAAYDNGASQVTLYVANATNNSGLSSGTFLAIPFAGDTTLKVGDGGFNTPFTGVVDNVFVYDRILSSTEISTIYSGGASAIPEPSAYAVALAVFLGIVSLQRLRKAKA